MEELHVGTMGWSYDFWKGNFYPEGSKNLLPEYAKNFDMVEIDNTFYRIPSRDTVMNWKEETPDDFIFSAKFPRKITHIKMLKDCEEELEVFIEHMSLMGNKLGPMLIQLQKRVQRGKKAPAFSRGDELPLCIDNNTFSQLG